MSIQCCIGDIGIGICPCHKSPVPYTTIFTSGAPAIQTNGKPEAIIGTTGQSSCGHGTIALTGSGLVTNNGIGSHRVGDTGQNCGSYVAVTGDAGNEVG